MPKKKYYTPAPSGRTWAQTGRLADVKIKPLSAAEKQKKAYAEADRLAAQRRKAVAAAKKPPTPLTPAQRRSRRAAALRERVEPGVFARLRKALGGR